MLNLLLRRLYLRIVLLLLVGVSMSADGSFGTPLRKRRVAVVGAGAAGLIATHELSKAGLDVTCFEASDHVGGVWKYSSAKLNAMYPTLRTNLPKEIMAYNINEPFPLCSTTSSSSDAAAAAESTTSFCKHDEVQRYLEHFAVSAETDVLSKIRFNTSVERARFDTATQTWHLDCGGGDGEAKVDGGEYEALVVCNGHYSQPFIPLLPGAGEHFRGRVMHAKEYDGPKPDLFANKLVLIVGSRNSATDIAREISSLGGATRVLVSDRNRNSQGDTTLLPGLSHVRASDGALVFVDQEVVRNVDVLIWCTGYLYEFPFLLESVQVQDGRRVLHLYEHLFHSHFPNGALSFIGLPFSIVPFPLFFLQALLVAHVLSSKVVLPPLDEQQQAAKRDDEAREQRGELSDSKYHYLGDAQWVYLARLANVTQVDPSLISSSYLSYMQDIYNDVGSRRPKDVGGQDDYRRVDYSQSCSSSSSGGGGGSR